MTRTVKIPDPAYDAASREAELRDVSIGVVVDEWRRDADRYREYLEGHLEEVAGGDTDE